MRRSTAIAIAAGGVVGASCRWGALEIWPIGRGFPWAVFVVNVIGSFIVGVALAEEWEHPSWNLWARDAIGIGFCGGLTTFSTFAVETAQFLRDGRVALAVGYVSASVAAAIVAAIAGAATRRRVGALTLPLEGPEGGPVTGVALAFVVAAAAGALTRAAIGQRLNRAFPWGTLSVNVSGSFALGLLANASTFAATVFGTGLLGAYTTFSSFARDTVGLWEQRHRLPAMVYVLASVVACIAGAWAGLALVD